MEYCPSGSNTADISFLEHVLGGQDFRAFVLIFFYFTIIKNKRGQSIHVHYCKKRKTRTKDLRLVDRCYRYSVIEALHISGTTNYIPFLLFCHFMFFWKQNSFHLLDRENF